TRTHEIADSAALHQAITAQGEEP
ncbi:MAG: hypothetical protein RL342_1940, partial [Pseudomonadota bacterium]